MDPENLALEPKAFTIILNSLPYQYSEDCGQRYSSRKLDSNWF